MIDPNFRYFVVKYDSFIHRALNDLEEAGSILFTKLTDIEAEKVVLVKITRDKDIKAISAVPENMLSFLPRLAFELNNHLATLPAEVVNNKNFITVAIPSYVSTLSPSQIKTPLAADKLKELRIPMLKIGSSPNFLERISQNPGAPDFGDLSKATLTTNDVTFQPEAYQVFGTWIIKLPQYVPPFGNDYSPPQCMEVTPEKVTEIGQPPIMSPEFNSVL